MNTIDPYTLLPVGSNVTVNGCPGVVVKSKMVRAIPSGWVCLHTIKFAKETREVNYSFIVPVYILCYN